MFHKKEISTTELRDTGKHLTELEKDPNLIYVVRRRGRIAAHLVSAQFFDIQHNIDEGNLVQLRVDSLESDWFKTVVAHRTSLPEDALQQWRVKVDGFEYEFVENTEHSETPGEQLLWRHHPRVAQAVLEHFKSLKNT